jgi:uncharacterized membrane protein
VADRELAGVVHRNIRALLEVRAEHERRRSTTDRIVDAVARFSGSLAFVLVHGVIVAGWLLVNLRVLPVVKPWDPYPFVMLAMAASVEAIFLSTFILIAQNRNQHLAEKRADLDLQINLLAEHEITRLIQLSEAVAKKLGVDVPHASLEELERDVRPEKVLEQLEEEERSPSLQ